jgi:hypothetical protein
MGTRSHTLSLGPRTQRRGSLLALSGNFPRLATLRAFPRLRLVL